MPHGGGQTRIEWHKLGYVDRLQSDFKVITVDIPGNGESDKPTTTSSYAIDKILEDILMVADACRTSQFSVLGFSFGGNIARYLAATSDRIKKAVIMSVPFGPAINDDAMKNVNEIIDNLRRIHQKQVDRTLDYHSLTESERAFMKNSSPLAWIATYQAMLSWGTIKPSDILCLVMLMIGTKNTFAMPRMADYDEEAKSAGIRLEFLEGFSHMQELTEIDKVLPIILSFLKDSSRTNNSR
jgi:pimeloyl-ACP methyl ester carboxylesterase